MNNITSPDCGDKYPATCKRALLDHGFESFENSDRSVSFYMPAVANGRIVDWQLITVSNRREVLIAVGY